MKISKSALTALAEEGYLTLQVPHLSINLDGSKAQDSDETEVPDDWLMGINTQGLPTTLGKGWWFLTRKGYEALKPDLKEALAAAERAGRARGSWSDFQDKAEQHFQELAANVAKKSANLRKQLAILEAYKP